MYTHEIYTHSKHMFKDVIFVISCWTTDCVLASLCSVSWICIDHGNNVRSSCVLHVGF